MIHILNCEPLNYCEEARRILSTAGRVHEPFLTREQLIRCLPYMDALIVRLGFYVDPPIIDAGRRLRVIASATTGLDHIDVEYARFRGITVISLQGENEFLRTIPATAEHTWGLLLALVRRVPWAFGSALSGRWDRDSFRGHDLYGKRLSIVGLGRIGEKVARYGLAFGMQVGAYDPYRRDWLPEVERYSTLPELLAHADVLSLHLPYNSETRRLIGAAELRMLPPGAVLLNTSRGQVLDEYALLDALQYGPLAGAALDVLSDERKITGRGPGRLLQYACENDNLLITPHIGGVTVESMAATEIFIARKVVAALQDSAVAEPVRRMALEDEHYG